MASENNLEKLRNLQDILSEKIKLEHHIQEIPKLLVTQEELLNRLKKTFIDKSMEQEKVKSSEIELRNLMGEAESQQEKAEKNMDQVTTQREYEALDKEIRDAKENEQKYRKDLLQKERLLLELNEQLVQHTALIEQQEAELAERRAGVEAEVAENQKQLDALAKREKKITADLDSEVVFKFERIIRNKMGLGIVAIKGNVCLGCHMILPIEFANKVRMGEEFVFCPYCSRILFYEETAEGEEEFFDTEDSGSLSDLDDLDEDDLDEDDEEEELVNIDSEE
jgi:predicted  nucleic acid-binding Zn-ribbon protein